MGPCVSRPASDPSYNDMQALLPTPASGRFVVAIDLGTVFSGFAYGDRYKPSIIQVHQEWPGQSELSGQPPSSHGASSSKAPRERKKTLTSIMYAINVPPKRGAGTSPVAVVTHWGWPAFLDNQRRMSGEGFGTNDGGKACYFTNFKLNFPAEDPVQHVPATLGSNLMALADFAISSARQKPGFNEIRKTRVQWFLTVPATWGHQSKERLKRCAQLGGLVTGPFCPDELSDIASPHPLVLLLESEVACVSPQSLFHGPGLQILSKLKDGTHHVVVADIGAATIDVVTLAKGVLEGVCGLKVLREQRRELGLTCPDTLFRDYLKRRLGFAAAMLNEYPSEVNMLMTSWEEVKCAFPGSLSDVFITLPPKLAELVPVPVPARKGAADRYGRIRIGSQELEKMFDPLVKRVVSLLKQEVTPAVKKLILVGGYSANSYIQRHVKAAFEEQLKNDVLVPDDPGTAVLRGAVRVGLSPGVFSTKRNTLRWFGLRVGSSELLTCMEYGQDIGHDFCFSQTFQPRQSGQKHLCFSIYTAQVHTRIISIDNSGVVPAAEFLMDISDDPKNLDMAREVELRIYFCRSNHIEITACPLNFGNGKQLFGFPLPAPSNPE